MQTTISASIPDAATLSREEQLTLSLDMKVREIEELKAECESRRSEILSVEKRYEETIDKLSAEVKTLNMTIKSQTDKIIGFKAKLEQANETIEMLAEKLS